MRLDDGQLFAEAQTGAHQRFQLPGSLEHVESPDGAQHALMHPALLAKALDDLEVGIRASAFDAKIHGAVSFPLHISGSGLMGAIANRRMSSEFGTTFQIRSDATHAKPSKLAENYFRSPFNCRRRVRVADLPAGFRQFSDDANRGAFLGGQRRCPSLKNRIILSCGT